MMILWRLRKCLTAAQDDTLSKAIVAWFLKAINLHNSLSAKIVIIN